VLAEASGFGDVLAEVGASFEAEDKLAVLMRGADEEDKAIPILARAIMHRFGEQEFPELLPRLVGLKFVQFHAQVVRPAMMVLAGDGDVWGCRKCGTWGVSVARGRPRSRRRASFVVEAHQGASPHCISNDIVFLDHTPGPFSDEWNPINEIVGGKFNLLRKTPWNDTRFMSPSGLDGYMRLLAEIPRYGPWTPHPVPSRG
jgi:hypothetical protein